MWTCAGGQWACLLLHLAGKHQKSQMMHKDRASAATNCLYLSVWPWDEALGFRLL